MPRRWIAILGALAALAIALSLAGCADEEIRNPIPDRPTMPLTIPWLPDEPQRTP